MIVEFFEMSRVASRISFALENTGDRPLHAVSELRRIMLDPVTAVLTLWLTERQPPRDASRPDRHVSHPRTRVIDPDRRTTIEFELPKHMTRIVTGPGNKFDFEPLDLSQARSVVLKISIDDNLSMRIRSTGAYASSWLSGEPILRLRQYQSKRLRRGDIDFRQQLRSFRMADHPLGTAVATSSKNKFLTWRSNSVNASHVSPGC